METSTAVKLAKASAYTQVCQKFLTACEDADIDPGECLQAIARFIGVPLSTSTNAPGLNPLVTPFKVQLTKEQIDQCLVEARKAKAKEWGKEAAWKEINLSSKEAKDAKAAARLKVSKGEILPSTSAPKKESKPSTESKKGGSSALKSPDDNSGEDKKKVGVQLAPSGARQTMKTRIDMFRKNALKGSPVVHLEPKVLHLVAFVNHINRLTNQWATYQKTYESSGMMNPLRGLPTLGTLLRVFEPLEAILSRLREMPDSPGTYVLQSDNGASYWDEGEPSEACPDFLKERLPEETVKQLTVLSGASN